jgi:hypothetical protein
MAATTNPTVSSLVPGGMNPTGTPIVAGTGTFSTTSANPYTNLPTSSGSNPNPYSSTIPNPGSAIPSPVVSTTGSGGLNGPYGALGPAIQQLLGSQGGYNPAAVQAILAQMQPGINAGAQNLEEQFGAAGGRFSSAAATGLANYQSQNVLNEGDIMAQLYEQSFQNYMNTILGVSGQAEQYEASRPSGWDIASGILGLGTSVAGLIPGL